MKHVLLLCGLAITSQAVIWGEPYPTNRFEVKAAKPINIETKPAETNINVKNLNEEQQKLFFGVSPKMVERTKIMNKVRKLKDQGEEKTKIIYRTRVIGLFDPKMISNLNTIDNMLNALSKPEEDEDFDSDSGEKCKFCKINKETNDINKEFEKVSNTEMPKNQHSSKKELRDNVKSAETLTVPENTVENIHPLHRSPGYIDLSKLKPATPPQPNKIFNHHNEKEHDVETHLKQPVHLFDKANFLNTIEDENDTGFAPRAKPIKASRIVDSLELYREKQKEQQALNELRTYVNTHLFHKNNNLPTLKPILRRQFSIYRYPNNVNNEHVENVYTKNDATFKPIFKQPSVTIPKYPLKNNVNTRIQEQHINTNMNNPPKDKINPTQPDPELKKLRQEWFDELLSRKLAEAEAIHLGRVKPVQGKPLDAHQREQQILHQEQQRQQIIA